MALKNSKYDGNGGLWVNHNSRGAKHPVMQGSIQIGGRTIALTIWNGKGNPSPDYNISVNEQKTSFDDLVWFKTLHMLDVKVKPDSISNAMREAHPTPRQVEAEVVAYKTEGNPLWSANGIDPDDDIPF